MMDAIGTDKAADVERSDADVRAAADAALAAAGMSRRELTARIERIPASLMARLHADDVSSMRQAIVPARGFGLSGGAGVGKTFALAALFRAGTEATIRKSARDGRHKSPLVWLSWPDTVNRLRIVSTRDGGMDAADRIVSTASRARLLVLDDIGAERIKGTYADDWAASLLDLIVDERHREMRPTWYTTNLPIDAFVRRYGQRLFSRLCAENQLIVLPEADDMRLDWRRSPTGR